MSFIATIPMAHDVAAVVGQSAERVQNRSLLIDKFIFHKQWPVVEGVRGPEKWDDATRWSFMRVAEGASELLNNDAQQKRWKANGKNVSLDKAESLLAEAKIAESLANVDSDSRELRQIRSDHTRRFLGLFRSAFRDRAVISIAELEGRLAINISDGLIQNAGICLDRLFGMPYLPGPAIKGVCRHAALEELVTCPEPERPLLLDRVCKVFGYGESDFKKGDMAKFADIYQSDVKERKGAVSFLSAYPVNDARIVVDLSNVHYPDYYRNGKTEDLSRERPRPNPFPAVERGAQFAFCLLLNDEKDLDLMEHVQRWLHAALTINGMGAKTAAGYGWFSLKPDVLREIEAEEVLRMEAAEAKKRAKREAAAAAVAEQKRRSALSPEEAAFEEITEFSEEAFANIAKHLGEKSEPEQRAFFRVLMSNEKRKRWKTWKKKKPDLAESLNNISIKLKTTPLP